MFMNHDDGDTCVQLAIFILGLFVLTNPCRLMPISFPWVGYKTTWGL